MMSRIRTNAVAIAVLAVLVVLVLVFHARLVAWFTGERMGGAYSTAVTTNAGGLSIASSISPDPPAQKGNRFRVEVKDSQGKPVDGAGVTVTYDMPAMGAMAEMKSDFQAKPAGSGVYTADIDLPMTGTWTMIVTVKAGTRSAIARYALTTGSKGLTPIGAEGGGAGQGSNAVAYYTCSMHTAVHSNTPGKCPICGMDLRPVTNSEAASGAIQIDPTRLKALGVRSECAAKAPMTLDIRAVGKLAYDETRLQDVVLKIGGYISGLRITATGQPVKKGDLLFEIYSPELYAAEQDLLLARESRAAMSSAQSGDDLVRAAETKLELYGLTREQIAAIAKSGKPLEQIAFRSPASGYVIEKDVVEGASIKAGERVFRIAPLDKLWVEAEVFEHDLPHVAVGLPATVTLDYIPGRAFDGKITYVYPYLDPTTRTGRVRIELPNRGLELKPDMYATVMLHVPLGERLQIPSSAVIYDGPRKIVMVDLGNGSFEPRAIKTGAKSDDRVEVLEGLKEGEPVVVDGNFLISAESRIRASDTFWKEGAK